MGLRKSKYLRNNSLRLLIPCAIDYYEALIDFIRHYLKRGRHKYKEWSWKKNDMDLYLVLFSFIIDIRPGSINEINILVFQKKLL